MLSYETVQKIGNMIGFRYIIYNGRSGIPEDSDSDIILCCKVNFVEGFGSRPPLLIFTPSISGHCYQTNNKTKSIYVLNMRTLRPTTNSFKQIELPAELKKQILAEL